MELIQDSKQINLNSSSAVISNGTKNSVFTFKLNGTVIKDKHVKYRTISVVHAEIPISYYVVNSNNNQLSITVLGVTTVYTLTNGNYNASTFKTMLLGLLGSTFNMSLNSSTGIYTITNTTNNFTINSTSTCYRLMGFAVSTSYTSTSLSLTLPYPCNFLGINRYNIKSTVLTTTNLCSYSNGRNNILVTIPVTNAQNGLVTYTNVSNFKSLLTNDQVDFFDISITDEYNNEIDFNGIDVFITLQIDSYRDSPIENESLIAMLQNIQK